jgi:hypothetical protein
LKISSQCSVTVKTQHGNCISGSKGGQEAKVKKSCRRRSASSASWREVMWIWRWLWRYTWGLQFHQGINNEDDAIEFGKSEKESYKRHQHHV